MIEIRTTAQFSAWFTGLRDRQARVREFKRESTGQKLTIWETANR